MLGRPEAFGWDCSQMRLSQQLACEIRRRLHSAASKVRRNIRIHVERTLRHVAFHSGQRTQSGDNVVAQLDVVVAHFIHAVLRPLQRCDCRFLSNRSRVRGGLALQLSHRRSRCSWRQAVAHAPSGHRVRLRERSRNHQAIATFPHRC